MTRPKLPCGHDESPYGYPCPCKEPELYGNGDPLPAPTRWEYSDPNPPRRESETPPYGIPSLDPGLLPPDFDPDPWASAPSVNVRVRTRRPIYSGNTLVGWEETYNLREISVSGKFTV